MARVNRWDWPFYWFYLRSFAKQLRRLRPRPDVVIVHNDLVAPTYVKRILPGAKVMVMLHNEQRTNLKDLGPTLRATERFLAVSGYIREWTIEHHPIEAGRIEVVPNGIDLEAFKPREGFADDAMAGGGTEDVGGTGDDIESKPAVKVLFIGRIDPNKGPDIAVDAVARLRGEGLAVCMTVAGGLWFYGRPGDEEDPYLKSLKTKMAACGAEYLGHVPRAKAAELVREHDVVCVLSRSNEPFGLVTLEAMASGCAVIASNRGGLPEACGSAAILHDPDDFEGIVGSLRSLVVDRAKLNEMKRKSLARAAGASWAATVDRLEPLLKL
jgi:glycosyltransferase involved in cell wall biosynthesis